MSSNIRVPKICQHCGTEFIAKTTVTQFCGDGCAKRAYKKRNRDAKVQEIAPVVIQKHNFNQQQVAEKDFLSIEETCKLLGASRMTLYRQIKKGTIRAGKIGRRTIIKRTEIDKLFQA
ncbi:excisionase family DNA binding protein [Dyadobacter jejuensis]|uniref:Excisionase family DNA binding protein n=2 Tax=Dyadobacter jejuensis TaxID=1082580 RepID=A0A316AGG7_9BACT|nr:excisionase family DNA binding protein [Dyadobacter jejuensis]